MEGDFANAIMASMSSRPSRKNKRPPTKYQDATDSLEDTYGEEKLSSEYIFA